MDPGENDPAKCGTRLPSSSAPAHLQNKFLLQAPSSTPHLATQPHSCPSLQPSSLSSTTSSLLSTSSSLCTPSLSSPLLSTQNTLLNSRSPLVSVSPSSSAPLLRGPPLSTPPSSGALLSRPAQSSPCHDRPGSEERGDGEDEGSVESSEEMRSYGGTSNVLSEEECVEESKDDEPMELPMSEMALGSKENDQTMAIRQEEYPELETEKERDTEELNKKKYLLLNAVCYSLECQSVSPGDADWDSSHSIWADIKNLAEGVSACDPEFLLKVAIYTRQELNIRITANFLLALAANQAATKPHFRRYFCAAVQLPSDWLEVVRIYSTCFSPSLPACLKKAMADKFLQFTEYQLAKYNTRKHRCKHNRNRPEKKKPAPEQLVQWARLLKSSTKVLQRLLICHKRVIQKKQSKFSIKKMIRKLHIKEPAEHVMAILGRKYPADAHKFTRSGLRGAWEREKAGKRMRLKEPETWERLLSLEGNNAATWERLIDNKSLPFMAMLRNLRNMITRGISEDHHTKILNRLTDKMSIIRSRQLPMRFLAAYKVIMELHTLAETTQAKMPSSVEILRGIMKGIPKSPNYKCHDWCTVERKTIRMVLRVPFVCRLYRLKKAALIRANQRHFTVALLDRYRQALETAVQISCRYNVPPMPGRTVIMLPTHMWDRVKNLDFCLPPNPNKEAKKTEEDKSNQMEASEAEEAQQEEEEEEENKGMDGSEGTGEEDVGEDETEEEEDEEGKEGTEEEKEEEQAENEDKQGSTEGQSTEGEDGIMTSPTTEALTLFALMMASSCEDVSLCLYNEIRVTEAELKSDVLLDNVWSVAEQMKTCNKALHGLEKFGPLCDVLERAKVDNIVFLVCSYVHSELTWIINGYMREANVKTLITQIYFDEPPPVGVKHRSPFPPAWNVATLYGYSEQTLRLVVERGSSRLLEHLEHLDKMYNVPPSADEKQPEAASNVMSLPTTPKTRWRCVRLFISSTFRDMHAERDVLVRSVFPELRRRAAPHCLYLQEVELRWGVTEEESARVSELCLSEVCRSHMLLGMLGERYGLVPDRPALPDLPQYGWLKSAPAGISVTEMEIRQFLSLYPDTAGQRMFCYFRDPNVTSSVPVAWRSNFASESKAAHSKMDSLKKLILDSGVKVTENYRCEWGGVVEGKPYLKGLEDFGKAVLEDVWAAIQKQFVDEEEEAKVASDAEEQQMHQEALQRQFYGRAKLLTEAVEKVRQLQTKGGLMLVEGPAGTGKTMFMAALAKALRSGDKSKKVCDVISYSSARSQASYSVDSLLRCLIQWLRKMEDTEEERPLPQTYQKLLSEFCSQLSKIKTERPLALLVDGVDLVQDGRGQIVSDWIPQELPQGLCLVLSLRSTSPLLQPLVMKRGAFLLTLGPLSVSDRREIVQRELEAFGKKLSNAALSNQLQTLVMKSGAASPLYLHLACEDLRNFASFEKLTENLQSLPQSLSQLLQHCLGRLCSQYRGVLGLHHALAALTVCDAGLRESDFHTILNTSHTISSQGVDVTWHDALQLSRSPRGRVPMATFTNIVQGLRGLISPSNPRDNLLVLTNPEAKQAFGKLFLQTERDRVTGHLLLAAQLWALADPDGTETFLHCEAQTIKQLPSCLVESGELEALRSLLSRFDFAYANVRHGLLYHLLELYDCHGPSKDQDALSAGALREEQMECLSFLQRHALLLSSWPALFIQQAFNEPQTTAAHIWARDVTGKGGGRIVEWRNSESQRAQKTRIMSTFACQPACVAISPDGGQLVVCTTKGTLHVIHTQTGQEIKSLVSSADGVSSCAFLSDGRLATTSFDGRIETWDIENGCRTAIVSGHRSTITGSDITTDRKHLATVSLDLTLKVWSSAIDHECATLHSRSPLNCVTFDPEGRLLAAGCWNGDVMMLNWLQNKRMATLSGHQHSVRSLTFSSSSATLCSGSVRGEVRVWSLPTSTCVGCFQAHCGSTDALAFLDDGAKLLSAGSDSKLHLWSGGLGQSVTEFAPKDCEQEPPQKKMKAAPSEGAALCVAAREEYAAVGYHGEGIKVFNLDSGEKMWATEDLWVSVLCLMWLHVEVEQGDLQVLVSGGADHRLRLWRRRAGEEGALGMLALMGQLCVQKGPILALAQSSSFLASASDDFTIALWSVKDFTLDPWTAPTNTESVLRGHTGGVTCLCFSPDGGQLLSGGKDQALMLWDVSCTPPVLSKSLRHSHRDWITGCVWTPACVLSSSNDGRLRFWDLQAGCSLREFTWRDPLTSICCQGAFVICGCASGGLHVWNWETSVEICHIAAHQQRVNHCCVLPSTDKTKDAIPEDMIVSTASVDGTVRLWKPFQVEHFSSFHGHNGRISGMIPKAGVPEVLTVAEDHSLRCWTLSEVAEDPCRLTGPVTVVLFAHRGDLLLVGYRSGLMEVWRHDILVGRKQVSDSSVLAICSMPDDQFAVSCKTPSVTLWKLAWNPQHGTASLLKISTHAVRHPTMHIAYCSRLIGINYFSTVFDVMKDFHWRNMMQNWCNICILEMIHNDDKSFWLLGQHKDNKQMEMGFMFAFGAENDICSSLSAVTIEDMPVSDESAHISAMTMDKEFVVCGDIKGNMWYNQSPNISSWSSRKAFHSDRISALKLTDSIIVSASYDKTVKLWDRITKKQVGMFVCRDPVVALELNPANPTELVCGDQQGKLYFLTWRE